MEVKDVRPVSQSRTIRSLDRSDRIQHIVIGLGALSFGVWIVLPNSWQVRIQERAIPIASAMMTGAGFAAKWYNSKAKDGRIDVGDLLTTLEEFGAREGTFAKVILMTDEEFQSFQKGPQPLSPPMVGSESTLEAQGGTRTSSPFSVLPTETLGSRTLDQEVLNKEASINHRDTSALRFPEFPDFPVERNGASTTVLETTAIRQNGSSQVASPVELPRRNESERIGVDRHGADSNGGGNDDSITQTAFSLPLSQTIFTLDLEAPMDQRESPQTGVEITEHSPASDHDQGLWDNWI